jgi:hypothetical protein
MIDGCEKAVPADMKTIPLSHLNRQATGADLSYPGLPP